MKTIIFHGVLKKMFCETLQLKVNSLKDIFKALYCNFPSYNTNIREIKQNCSGLALILDGKLYSDDVDGINKSLKETKIIEIVPCAKLNIFSSLAAVLVSIGVQAVVAKIIAFVVIVAISVGISFLVSSLMKPGDPKQLKTSSYIFSTQNNISARNTPVPLNYGRLMANTSVISAALFSFDIGYAPFNDSANGAIFSLSL